ncbi:amino acid ABC transporter permease [Bifidobacterium vespertilionis]|uniref:Amino acid ABC transporter permease n=2 Tax=Bifidobacterium vespertilionis TaxID=2562524 RepID=A0A5J5E161_9BIFI|nr:amino acid ABC transporter permease [Bifidobacterium vespertilionis]KAA8822816.1 amino acid ABC transporter permease [Bifidobacterium vespertilionis]
MTPTEAALFETTGPRARRRILIGTVLSAAALAALVAWIVYRFYIKGQLASQYWYFFAQLNVWEFIGMGLLGTMRAALGAGAIALVVGLILMLGRTSKFKPVSWLATAFIEFFRGTPTLLFIYAMFLVPAQMGLKVSTYWMVVIPVSAYASAVLAEVYRAGAAAVPKGQKEAGVSLGLTDWQNFRYVVMPQMFRIVTPTLVTQLVVVVKDTSFGYVVTYPELMVNAKVLIANFSSLIPVYLVIALIYILVNLAISRFANWLSRRQDVKVMDISEALPRGVDA